MSQNKIEKTFEELCKTHPEWTKSILYQHAIGLAEQERQCNCQNCKDARMLVFSEQPSATQMDLIHEAGKMHSLDITKSSGFELAMAYAERDFGRRKNA